MNNEAVQAKLADLERQVKDLKEQLAAGWSTEEKCRAFVDSEGGPERFAEILGRGIL